MKRTVLISFVVLALLTLNALARPVQGETAPQLKDRPTPRVKFPATTAIASADTVYLLGGPGTWDGSFETPGGQPDWHGWTHEDVTIDFENHWHVSTYMADQIAGKGPGNHAMYCGDETIMSCSVNDTIGGYGNSWFEQIEWRQTIADTSQAVTVHLTGSMNYDTESAYDHVYLMINRGANEEVFASWTGQGSAALNHTAVLSPGDFTGPENNEVRLAWRFRSDGGRSDEDCSWPTRGACQIDDLAVYLDGNLISLDDFEPGNPVHWNQVVITAGDFTNLRNDLGEIDPCRGNNSWKVNFVDDGLVVPGTGGTPCVDWCYDPGGWIVNHTGGLLEQWYHLKNQVISPPIPWTPGHQGAELAFDTYVHEDISPNSSGVFYYFRVRSTASADPADLDTAPWQDRRIVYYGFPEHRRHEEPVSDLLVPDRQWVQIALTVEELGWIWGWEGNDGTPAPYFDNVSFKVWDYLGPGIQASEDQLFGDSFPENGAPNPDDLASNWCRVDSRNAVYPNDSCGDSLVVTVSPLRPGATVAQPPSLHWVMKTNQVFDAVRSGAPDAQGLLRGMVVGGVVPDEFGDPVENTWSFDLPDTGFFFPGDMIRYYITASDDLGGNVHTSVLPPDTTGFLDFGSSSTFPLDLEVFALPTLTQPAPGQFSSPTMLLYDGVEDNQKRLFESEDMDAWFGALRELGLVHRVNFDLIRAENLAFSASAPDLAPYQTLLYCADDNGIFEAFNLADEGVVISSWMDQGGKQVLLMGSKLTSRTFNGSANGLVYRLGFRKNSPGQFPFVEGDDRVFQVSPVVGNGILPDASLWQINGYCPTYREPETIFIVGDGQTGATLDPQGQAGGPNPALVTVDDQVLGNRSAVLPFGLDWINGMSMTADKSSTVFSPQASLLNYLLVWLGTDLVSGVENIPGIGQVAVTAHPNPFNPSTTIAFDLLRAMDVSLDIYDLQGRLVRRLLDENPYVTGSHKQVWDGRDSGGQTTASGVYFYRFTAGDQKRVGKLTLLK